MRYLLASMAIVLCLAAAATSQDPKKGKGKEPKSENPEVPSEYLGKSFEQWKKEISSTDPNERDNAMKAVLFFGPKRYEAVPDIIALLKRHTSNTPLDLSSRITGTMALSTIFKYETKPDPKHVKDAVALYKTSLKDSQIMMKMRALQGVAYLGTPARDLIEEVIKLVREPATWEVRKEAIPVMVMMAPQGPGKIHPKAVPELKRALDDRACPVRVVALQGLTILNGTNSLSDIQKALDDSCVEMRTTAAGALASLADKLYPADKTACAVRLKAQLKAEKTCQSRIVMLQALAMVSTTNALPEIYKCLNDPCIELRTTALNLTAGVADKMTNQEKTVAVIKLKANIMAEKEIHLKFLSHAAIMAVTKRIDKEHMQPILDGLSAKEQTTRLSALQVIGMGGEKSKPLAYRPVLSLLEDKDLDIATAAMSTLFSMDAAEAIPTLQAIMKDTKRDEIMRQAAEDTIDNFAERKRQLELKKKEAKTP